MRGVEWAPSSGSALFALLYYSMFFWYGWFSASTSSGIKGICNTRRWNRTTRGLIKCHFEIEIKIKKNTRKQQTTACTYQKVIKINNNITYLSISCLHCNIQQSTYIPSTTFYSTFGDTYTRNKEKNVMRTILNFE